MRRSSRLATLSRTPRGATSFARALQQTEMLKDTNPETILAAVEKLAAHRSDFDEDFVPTPQIKPKRRKKQTATKVAPIKKPGPLQGEPKQSTLTDWVRNNLPVKPKRTPPKTRPTKPRRTPAPKRPVKPKKQYVKQPKRPKSMPLATFLKEALKKQAVTSKKQSVALYKLIESAADPRLLSEEIAADFFPDSERSAPFVTSKDPESPKAQIPVLRSCQFSENEKTVSKLIFYAGGTVSSLAWLKIREKYQDDPDREHFLAIGVHQEINPIHFNGKQFSSKNMIQIWSIQGIYTPSEQSPLHQKSATFCIGICHEYGCVFEVQWCPYTSTYEDDELSNHVGGKKSLGLLSACFGDGTLRVFNVPHPDSITRTKAREPLYVQLEPVLTFRIENTNILRASWKVTSTDAYLLYCNSSGTACVWHGIHNQENKEYIDEEKGINAPMISFRAHKKEIIALAWHPTNPYLFLTTSHQPPIKVWDIRDPVMPVFSHKNIHKTTSLRYWNSTFSEVITASALGNIVLLKDSNTNSRVYYTHYGPIWDLSVSEYLQQAATCSEDGSCNATFIKDFPNKIRSSDVCLTIQMAELDQREDGVLILQFPGSSILVKKAEVLKVDSFPDLVIGWSTLAWSPNKQSCNWLACGANVGLVCIVPYLSDVPITKKRT